MKFNKPEYLYLLFLALPIILWLEVCFKKRKSVLEENFSRKNLKVVGIIRKHSKIFLKNFILVIVFVLIIFTLAQPQYGFKEITLGKSKTNIFIALDVSLSMNARDVKPSRLEVAKRKIIDFLRYLNGEQVALVCFAGVPFINIPLTDDYSIFNDYLRIINTDLIPVQGTNFYKLIVKIIDVVKRKGLNGADILILSDGENFSGDIEKAIKLCKKYNVKIFSLGIGGTKPVPIKLADGTLKKDKYGKIVMTSLNEKFLEKISLETGGVYVRATYSSEDIKVLYSKIEKNNKILNKSKIKKRIYINRFQWFLFPCFILLCFYFLINDIKKITILLLISGFLFTGHSSLNAANPSVLNNKGVNFFEKGEYSKALKNFQKAYKIDRNPVYKYNEAVTLYKLNKLKKADSIFSQLQVNCNNCNKLKEKILYNRGVIAYKNRNYKLALKLFKKAIITNPNDIDARIDYELTLKKLKNSNSKKSKKDNNYNKKDKKENQNKNRKKTQLNKNKSNRKRANTKNSELQKLLNLYNENPEILKEIIRKKLKKKINKDRNLGKDW